MVNGKVRLENFQRIPVLTKEIIRKESKRLCSKDYKQRKPYENTSGGSTGEPVRFMQDLHYEQWNTANKLNFFSKLGKDTGEKEIKLWGSDRDILEGTAGIREKLISFLYNRTFLNTFDLTKNNFASYIKCIHDCKPVAIWAYYDSMQEIARYINKNNLKVHNPKVIVTTIGKLTEEMFEEIKTAFPRSKVVEQYGSREVGAIAVQYEEKGNLFLFPWSHHLEIIDENNTRIFNKEGRVCITPLENYTMPLIRYEIGDMGTENSFGGKESFSLREISGRIFAHFIKEDGTLVHAQFFVTLMFYRDWVEKFEFIQRSVNDIQIRVKVKSEIKKDDLLDIEEKIKRVMGENCTVNWDIVEQIQPAQSGKYLYTRRL